MDTEAGLFLSVVCVRERISKNHKNVLSVGFRGSHLVYLT